MGLTAWALRAAAERPRVLLAPMPGSTELRVAVERELRRRDLPLALTPAEADILLVTGLDWPGLRAAVERLWHDMPAPRSWSAVRTVGEIASALTAAQSRLATCPAPAPHAVEHGNGDGLEDQFEGDQERASGDEDADGDGHQPPESEEHQGEHTGQEEQGHQEHDHGGQEHQEHDDHSDHSGDDGGQEGHGGHGHGEMKMPAGLPMADTGPDRDGLALDRLHVSLGPLLADWPAGLTLRLTLQGDVIQEVETDSLELSGVVPGSWPSFWTEPWARAAAGEYVSVGEAARRRAASHLDSLGRLLAVAGWSAMATTARRLRDDLLDMAAGVELERRVRQLSRQMGRSHTLHWLTRGLGQLSAADARAAGVGGPAVRADGDVSARYRQWLAAVAEGVARLEDATPLDPSREEGPRGLPDGARAPSAALVEVLPGLLEGAELAAARLIVASLDPDPDELVARPLEVAGG
ncbi:hypothetical protein [Streptomyces sp. SLBN-31]|uniref:hypothetical protein n=1 Tax=Streptomyces sp. SLBN-31 TaxID=2768444 RepID=UPI001150ADEC|nr:hypothetical protein [Streptomyces sp. SLBN-31]TQJ91278.1 hypothetical protein FBY22_2090 [Streptomyces sp. SLBN-31]